jgi:hypothetical protein
MIKSVVVWWNLSFGSITFSRVAEAISLISKRHRNFPTPRYMLAHKRNGQVTAFAFCFISPALFAILRLLAAVHPVV